MNELNILIGNTRKKDKKGFFGPLANDDVFVRLPLEADWTDVAVCAKIFPSKGQARKNGYKKEIEDGFSDTAQNNPFKKSYGIGKKNTRICILKIKESHLRQYWKEIKYYIKEDNITIRFIKEIWAMYKKERQMSKDLNRLGLPEYMKRKKNNSPISIEDDYKWREKERQKNLKDYNDQQNKY